MTDISADQYAISEMWVDKYAPTSFDEYVFPTEKKREEVQSWLESKTLPHMLLTGKPGTGKTSMARMLVGELDVPEPDICFVNASRFRHVEDVTRIIETFTSTGTYIGNDYKIVLLDEADYLSPTAQATLRGIIEEVQEYTRFIFTANYPEKIIDAIKSRCTGKIHIEAMPTEDYMIKIGEILATEGIEFTAEQLEEITERCHPDLRLGINSAWLWTLNSERELRIPDADDNGAVTAEWMSAIDTYWNTGNLTECRKVICASARKEEYGDIFTYLYENVERLFPNVDQQEQAILAIREALRAAPLCGDHEINLAALLIQLKGILVSSK